MKREFLAIDAAIDALDPSDTIATAQESSGEAQ
jgi:hypothetical protein